MGNRVVAGPKLKGQMTPLGFNELVEERHIHGGIAVGNLNGIAGRDTIKVPCLLLHKRRLRHQAKPDIFKIVLVLIDNPQFVGCWNGILWGTIKTPSG